MAPQDHQKFVSWATNVSIKNPHNFIKINYGVKELTKAKQPQHQN